MGIKQLLERLRGKDKYEAQEKRQYARLVYPSTKRPKFVVRDDEMEIIDISEKGIKFIKDKHSQIAECVHGTTKLLSGKSIDVAGKIIWERENEVGLLITQIKEAVIIEEIREVLRQMGSDDLDEEG